MSKGDLQSLRQSAATFAGMVVAFLKVRFARNRAIERLACALRACGLVARGDYRERRVSVATFEVFASLAAQEDRTIVC